MSQSMSEKQDRASLPAFLQDAEITERRLGMWRMQTADGATYRVLFLGEDTFGTSAARPVVREEATGRNVSQGL